MKHTTTAKFTIERQEIEVTVEYDRKEPENYVITSALFNGQDVTAFYAFADSQGEGLFYPQIVEAIAAEICADRVNKYMAAKYTPVMIVEPANRLRA